MRLRWAVVLLGAGIALAVAGPAWPLSQPHPQPAEQLSVRGFLKGRLGEDREVRLALIAAHPKGFFRLQTLTVALTLHGQSIQDLAFSVHDLTLTVGRNPPVPLTREAPPTSGGFLGVEPAKSHFVRSTFSVRLELRMFVTAPIPDDAIFRITAADDEENVATALRRPQLGRPFLSWGTLAVAVALAAFVGAFAGNTLSSRRYRQREPSIWDILERRLREQKARPPSLAASRTGGPG